MIGFGQYSNYYNVNANINKNVNVTGNVNKNVNVSGNVKKTVTTIDYGALANANAQREKNRIENLKMENLKDKEAMLAIASDPSKAYDYGKDNNWKVKDNYFKKKKTDTRGYKKFTYYHKIPHKSLFNRINNGYNYQNISDNGIETILFLGGQRTTKYVLKEKKLFKKLGGDRLRKRNILIEANESSLENALKFDDIQAGEIYDLRDEFGFEGFVHKKDLNRATVFGFDGFVASIISEDDYEFRITDYYYAISRSGDVIVSSQATFSGDKEEISFEDLEGRRYYFRKLFKRTIGSAHYKDTK
jgi:hypothetical protein